MSKRHHAQPGQLSLWGLYELENQAVAATSCPRQVERPVAEVVPIFKAAPTVITFRSPGTRKGPTRRICTRTRGANVINFQAVSRPSDVQNGPDATGSNENEPAGQASLAPIFTQAGMPSVQKLQFWLIAAASASAYGAMPWGGPRT